VKVYGCTVVATIGQGVMEERRKAIEQGSFFNFQFALIDGT
jgi:hypothetical protein